MEHSLVSHSLPQSFIEALRAKPIHLFAGKGGVGRSTLAVASAQALAEKGYRTLLAEIDEELEAPSSLALHLEGAPSVAELSASPVEVGEHLSVVRLTGRRGQEIFLTSLFKVESVAKTLLGMEALQKLARVTPSLRELGAFYHLLSCMRKLSALCGDLGEYDKIVLDLPATGHFLGMTALPELVLELIPKGPIAKALEEGQKILYDTRLTATWVVTLPEEWPVSEAIDLMKGLKENRLPIEGVLLNRLPKLPEQLSIAAVEKCSKGPGSIAAVKILEAIRVSQFLSEEAAKNYGVQVAKIEEQLQAASTAAVTQRIQKLLLEGLTRSLASPSKEQKRSQS